MFVEMVVLTIWNKSGITTMYITTVNWDLFLIVSRTTNYYVAHLCNLIGTGRFHEGVYRLIADNQEPT